MAGLRPLLLFVVAAAGTSANAAATATTNMEAKILNQPHLPDGLREAQTYAGSDGFVVSLPQLFHARAQASFDNEIWNQWFTANTEESVIKRADGKYFLVVVHGGGILGDPARIDRVFTSDGEGMTSDGEGRGAAKLSDTEAADLLVGRVPSGSKIPMYDYADFINRTTTPSTSSAALPRRYGVLMDYDLAKQAVDGYVEFDKLKKDPLMIVRAGGVRAAATYLDKFQSRHNTTKMGNWHPFGRVNADEAQTRIVFLSGNTGGVGSDGNTTLDGYESDYGIGGDANINNRGRFIGVRAVEPANSLRNLDYGRGDGASDDSDRNDGGAAGVRLAAAAVFEGDLTAALRQAQWRAGPDGFLASLPELIHARLNTSSSWSSHTNEIWANRLTAYSDQSVVNTLDGKRFVVTVHGGGVFSRPERVEQTFRMDDHSLTGQYAGKLSKNEALNLLKGALPDGTKVPVFPSFKAFTAAATGSVPLPRRYAVVVDFDLAAKSPHGYTSFDKLRNDPLFIVNCGGPALAAAYLARWEHWGYTTLGNWPPFGSITWHEDQSRVLFLDGGSDSGVLGTNGMVNMGRYVVVAPSNETASLRHLPFDQQQ